MSCSDLPSTFLPCSAAEIRARGWKQPDIVFVSGDAYLDHPSFAAALLGRVLEDAGYKVALLAQPDWRSADAWRGRRETSASRAGRMISSSLPAPPKRGRGQQIFELT